MGGARRDEENARAKERIFSFRDDFGQWNPRAQRPELWNLYNGRIRKGEQIRVFPISNWTELDVWQYIAREQLELPSIYFAHEREVFRRDGMLYAVSDFVERLPGEDPFSASVRFRTVGDMTCTGGVESRGRDDRRGRHRDRRDEHHRARRDPRRRPRLAKRRWRTGSAMATSESMMQAELLRLVTAGSVDDGKSTLIGRLLYDTKQILADQLEHIEETSLSAAATATSTSRSSPTACAPSASRGSRSTSPTARSSPRAAASSSPTRRATSSTRATWSPAPRPPTSR